MNKTPPKRERKEDQADADEAKALARRRAADAEARRQIEDANRKAQEREAVYGAKLKARNAILQAEVEEKQAAVRAKAEARKAAAKTKAVAKEAALKAKAEATAQKKADAALVAEKKAELQVLKTIVRNENRAQTKRLGLPLSEMVRLFVRVFSMRGDVHVLRDEQSPKMELESLLKHRALPAEVLSWYEGCGALAFAWAWEKDGPVVAEFKVPEVEELQGVDCDGGPSVSSFDALFEEIVPRGFINRANDEELRRLISDSSHRFSTTACLVDALAQKGVELKQANSLVKWLGASARILVHSSETKEGQRRQKLMAESPDTDGGILRRLVAAMNEGPPLEKKDWQGLLADHEGFVDAGGAGGSFVVTAQRGLPVVSYRMDTSAQGQALVTCENFNGAKFERARLPYSGLVGIRAEKVSFAKADLSHACLRHSILSGAKFGSANLTNCDFSSSRLVGGDFRGADLTDTNFERADLTGANFAGAQTKNTKFGGATMQGVKY